MFCFVSIELMTKGSIGTLLVVALAALAMMTVIGYNSNSDTTGAFSGPSLRSAGPIGPGSIGPSPTRPIIIPTAGHSTETTYVYDQTPQTTGSDVAQVQLSCYIWKYDHAGVAAPVEIQGLCARFGVSV